ncbi:acetate/propionate family kinase [Stagnihabitans tardus]|uniref:Acetate kinase n=1 Tax=Stagnihabitans tardus TaxID=2699202 RepID=A0AAE4YF10_9RHOB|nr:acetate kinase [Stagnihabitans tardus]NBZ88964.1 acetate kinase [Stagnihabitans tardus]
MLLVVNAGSSSLKLAGFAPDLTQVAEARFERIGAGGPPDHRAALLLGLAQMPRPTAAAHRVVHGGAALTAPARLTPQVEAQIEACIPLAPLHNPANLQGMRALRALMPDLPQFASFDTAFHATNPCVATRYALPPEAEALGLRRYGFHGLSYAALVRKLQETGPEALPKRLLAFHLGNGASACAILDGRSMATTMGYSPLSGLTMGTRTGEIDGNAVLRLVAEYGLDETTRLLNRGSGLQGLAGASDMRNLRAARSPEAAFALDHFTYWAARHGASLTAAMGGLDAVAFTGGIGENDAQTRAAILGHLAFLGEKPVLIIPAEEERQIAREARALMA